MNYITKNNIIKSYKGNSKILKLDQPFIQVPKSLFSNKKYRKLTAASKIVYMGLLGRIGLSINSGMCDEQGRYYVKMSREKAEDELGISFKTFERAKQNLVEFGLLEIKKINERVHHLYVLLPENNTNSINNDIPDFKEQEQPTSAIKEKEIHIFENFDGTVSSILTLNKDGKLIDLVKIQQLDHHSSIDLIKRFESKGYKIVYHSAIELDRFKNKYAS
jgi:hypothetical protein